MVNIKCSGGSFCLCDRGGGGDVIVRASAASLAEVG